MNKVHAAREAAPIICKKRKEHPVDRICEAQHHIKGLSVILNYAIRKSGEHEDGPHHDHLSACCDAISWLAGLMSDALDELCLEYDVKPNGRGGMNNV